MQLKPFIPLFFIFFAGVAHARFESLGVKPDEWAEDQIRFWGRVYTDYSTREGLIHDSQNLKIVYRVIPADTKLAEEEKDHIRATLTDEEAKKRLRFQIGQKDRLENAFAISKRYLKRMEEMFVEEGVPIELTRLPFVESGFATNAKSSVGALGIWQFMPKTAMKDLRVDSSIDERRDPLKATRAAARFLKSNQKLLKNWSLAVMAYHHGPGLVQKAIKQLKTSDPLRIVREFKDPNFQFASRNYLFEFLAMLDVDAKHALFFKTQAAPLPSFITISFQVKKSLPRVIQQLQLNEEEIKLLNPHFLDPIWTGKVKIPAHYPIRLSGISLEDFRKASML